MAHEPIPETIDDQEARRRSVERLRQQAANGHAPARRLNGRDHAPAAPAAEISWGPVIGQVAADCQRQIAVLKEYVNSRGVSDEEIAAFAKGMVPFIRECVAEAVTADAHIDAFARGMVPFVKEVVAEATRPLAARNDEIESVVRSLVEWRARNG